MPTPRLAFRFMQRVLSIAGEEGSQGPYGGRVPIIEAGGGYISLPVKKRVQLELPVQKAPLDIAGEEEGSIILPAGCAGMLPMIR